MKNIQLLIFLTLQLISINSIKAQEYSIVNLLPPGALHAMVYDINNHGTVVIQAYIIEGSFTTHFLWNQENGFVNIGKPSIDNFLPVAMNDSGFVLGNAYTGLYDEPIMFLWNGITWLNLGNLGSDATAVDMNNDGVIVGNRNRVDGVTEAFVYEDGIISTFVADPTANWTRVVAINNVGQITGYFSTANGISVFCRTDTTITVLGAGEAESINDYGNVVGFYADEAALWIDETMINLGTMGGRHSYALWINNSNEIVGYASGLPGYRDAAFLWKNGQMHNLNNFISPGLGWDLYYALRINNQGDIIGEGENFGGGDESDLYPFIMINSDQPRPDLTPIRSDGKWRADLTFEESTNDTDWVRIGATIQNVGDATTTGVVIDFFEGEPDNGGISIGTINIAEIPAGNSREAKIDWLPGVNNGKDGIFVIVDPNNIILEDNEDNNTGKYYHRPVILVPGIVGSPLYESNDAILSLSECVWVASNINTGLNRILLNHDGTSKYSIQPGPSTEGMQEELKNLALKGTFSDLVNSMQDDGFTLLDNRTTFTRTHNLFIFLYDWRLVGSIAASQLAAFVDIVLDSSDCEKVDLITHSMGGLVAKKAVATGMLDDTMIEHLFFIGTPHLGAPKLFYVFKTGRFIEDWRRFFIKERLMQELAMFSAGALQLMPTENYFNTGPYVYLFNLTPARFPLDYNQTRQLLRLPNNQIPFDASETFTKSISSAQFGEIDVINIIGINEPTIVEVKNVPKARDPKRWKTHKKPVGDGTVPQWSAGAVLANEIHYISGTLHEHLPSEAKMINLIHNKLHWFDRSSTSSSKAAVIAQSSHESTHLEFIMTPLMKTTTVSKVVASRKRYQLNFQGSNILSITDNQGRINILSDAYEVMKQISGSVIEIFGAVGDSITIFVDLPADNTYQVQHSSIDDYKTSNIVVSQTSEIESELDLVYSNLNGGESSNYSFEIGELESSLTLNADIDGDLIYESAIEPTYKFGEKEVSFSAAGWHMFSPPVNMSNYDASTILDGITAFASFAWNGSSYLPADTLRVGYSYWLSISNPVQPQFYGSFVDEITLNLGPGWHMLGPVGKSVDFSNPNENPDGAIVGAFQWEPVTQNYIPATIVEPGNGVWVAVLQECILHIGAEPSASNDIGNKRYTQQQFAAKFGIHPPMPPSVHANSETGLLPTQIVLYKNYPNPFNLETTISFSLPEPSRVTLTIYNALGAPVHKLLNKDFSTGRHQVSWNGRNESDKPVSSGLYIYCIKAGEFMAVRKMLLLK